MKITSMQGLNFYFFLLFVCLFCFLMFQQHPATFFLFSLKLSGSLGLLNTAHSIYYFQHYLSQVVVEMITLLSSIHFKLYNVFITNKGVRNISQTYSLYYLYNLLLLIAWGHMKTLKNKNSTMLHLLNFSSHQLPQISVKS